VEFYLSLANDSSKSLRNGVWFREEAHEQMNNFEQSDTRFIGRVLAGETEAFALLSERYRPRVFALCLQWTHNPADADDLAQETLLRAYSCLDQVREPARFWPWLAQIAINACKNWRSRVRQDLLPLVAVEVAFNEEDRTEGIVLREAMATLSPELRQVIEWFYLDGFSQKEIAVLWRLPQSTIKGRLDTGRLRLRKEYRKMGLLPEEAIEEAIPASRVALTDADTEETKPLLVALKAAGYTCTVVKQDEMILPRLRRFRPDILVLNSPFGELDEYDILQTLRIDQRLRGTAVMFLSPRNDDVSVFKAWNSGVECYLTKPCKVTEVVHFVGKLDEGRKAKDYVGLAIEYAWRRQTAETLRCLQKAVGLDEEGSAVAQEAVAQTIRTESAFNYLRATPEFATILAKLPLEEQKVEGMKIEEAKIEESEEQGADKGNEPLDRE
jgi:RNA polymerase sigma-70 factor, ECF subfamily